MISQEIIFTTRQGKLLNRKRQSSRNYNKPINGVLLEELIVGLEDSC